MSQSFGETAPQDQHHQHADIHSDVHQLGSEAYIQAQHSGQLQTYSIHPDAHGIAHSGGYHSDTLLDKQLVVGVGDAYELAPGSPEGSPDRKRRRMNGEQQVKRHKYDVLKSFFRIYFKVDNQSMVLKDAIYNLYNRKIPNDSRIARNAMYRHMWAFFKEDKISAFQSNYREYIKGIKLLTGSEPLSYEGFEKDLEVLQSIGVQNLFDFHEDELAKSSAEQQQQAAAQAAAQQQAALTGIPIPLPAGMIPQQAPSTPEYMQKTGNELSDEEILRTVEMMEVQAKQLSTSIKDLKQKLANRKK